MAVALAEVVALLEELAPLRFAEPWDNVGLLIDPPLPDGEIQRALLTIDLTHAVLEEAVAGACELVIAYHPPIFKPLSRLTRAAAPVALAAVRAGIAVYSPHTAADAAVGGVNDWLADALGAGGREPLMAASVPEAAPGTGMGRRIALATAFGLEEAVRRVKEHLGLAHVRVAASERHARGVAIQSVAVCAGAGGAVFERISGVDLYVTGEMRHHDVLAKVAAGSSVILCDHTNTERGYLRRLAAELHRRSAGRLDVSVSERDADPLSVS